MILVIDLGNTRWKMGLVDNGDIIKVSTFEYPISKNIIQKFIQNNYPDGTSLISVNPSMEEIIPLEGLLNLYILNKKNVLLNVDYKGILGPHRIAAALGGVKKFGFPLIIIDAGSAITVDVMEEGRYKGGYIFPGLKAMLKSYEEISPVLKTELNKTISLVQLPTTTKEQISYGIIASIKALIDKHSNGQKLYFTGGDGHLLSTFFEEARYDEKLVFYGMQRAIKVQGLTC